jgi:hypothetical protein
MNSKMINKHIALSVVFIIFQAHYFLAALCTGLIVSIRLLARFNSRATGQILMKFGMGVMLLEVTSYLNFLQPVIPVWRTPGTC